MPSVRSSRKIRGEPNELETTNSLENPEENPVENSLENPLKEPLKIGEISWEEACSNELINPGMSVKFEKSDFENIELTQEETGKAQTLSGYIERGIVVKTDDNELGVVTGVSLEPLMVLNGRFGNVFGWDAIQKVRKEIINQTVKGIGDIISIDWKKFVYLLMYSPLFVEYAETYLTQPIFLDRCKKGDEKVWKYNYIYFDESSYEDRNFKFHSLSMWPGSVLEGTFAFYIKIASNAKCCIKPCTKQITCRSPISFKKNMYDKFIVI